MSFIDLSIVGAYLVATLLIGLWQSKSIKSMKDYTIAERNYSTFVIVATVAASWFGGGTSIGKVEKIFNHGTVYLLTTVGLIIQLLIMSEFLVKKFKPYMGLLTVGDIMERMYGKKAKIITGIFGTIISVSFLGSQIAALGYFMTTIFNVNMFTAVILSYGIVIVYSSFGGIRSVAITDVFQFIIIVIMIPALVYLSFKNYGLGKDFLSLIPRQKLNFTDISHDNYKYFYMMLVFTVPTLIPMSIQRILMSKDVEQSCSSFRWSVIILLLVSSSMAAIALLATITMPEVNANQVIPIMIRDLIPIGIKGLVIAGFLAIIMSSADSFLHSAGVCLTHDFLKPILKKNLPVQKELLLTKILTFAIGGLSIVTAIHTDSLVEAIHRGFGFWMPAVLIPLIAGLLNYRKTRSAYYMSVASGTIAVFLCMYFDVVNAGVTLLALLASFFAYLIFGKRVKI